MFWSRVLSMLQTIFLSRISCSALDRLLDSITVRSITLRSITLGSLLLACPLLATAQRHGGGGSTGGGLSGISRPDGVSEKDSLKDFHDAMAVQATSQQVAAFQGLL
jgi:hypothetical protein